MAFTGEVDDIKVLFYYAMANLPKSLNLVEKKKGVFVKLVVCKLRKIPTSLLLSKSLQF